MMLENNKDLLDAVIWPLETKSIENPEVKETKV